MYQTKFWEQWRFFLTVTIAMISFEQIGILSGWPSPVLARLQKENSSIPMTSDEGSWLATIPAIVGLCWAPFAAIGMNYFGCKRLIIFSAIPYLISWIMVAFATSTTELIIARGIFGVGSSATFTVVPVYLGEISKDSLRGGIGVGMNVVSNFGTLLIYWIGTHPDLWVSSLVSAFPLIFIIIFAKWLPDSPYYLTKINQPEEAKKSLRKLRNTDKIEEEFSKIEAILQEHNQTSSFKELFTEVGHRRALFICMGVMTIAQLTGGISLLFYAHLIFQKAGNVSPNTLSMIKATLQLISSVGAAYVVDNLGRKPLLITSCIGSAVFMFCEGIYFYLHDNNYNVDGIWWLPLVSMILFNIFQVIGLNSISVSYLGELFHPKVKAIAVGICKSYLSLLVFTAGKLFQVLTDAFGNSVPFFFYAVIGIIGLAFVIFCVPETKGKSIDEIFYYMQHKTYEKTSENVHKL